MGAHSVQELAVWQLADQIRTAVYAFLANPTAQRDLKFRDQLRDATASIGRNIAEGFGRDSHTDFARFLVIARGSVFEVEEGLRDGCARGYWSSEALLEVSILCRRETAALSSLIKYLRATSGPEHRL